MNTVHLTHLNKANNKIYKTYYHPNFLYLLLKVIYAFTKKVKNDFESKKTNIANYVYYKTKKASNTNL